MRTQRLARPKIRFSLELERDMLSVPVMRQVLGDTLRRIGVNEDSIADILLAATEACSNAVLHAGQSTAGYTVTLTVHGLVCRVEVTDAGNGCRPRPVFSWRRHRPAEEVTDAMPGDPAALAESGRGFAIMQACVDSVTLRSTPGQGTRVVLHKRIQRAVPPPIAA